MIKRLLTLHRPALFGLWTILCLISISAYAQTYELNVGDSRTLYAPDPPMGTLDIGEWSSSNSNVWVFGKGSRNESAEVKVANYFSGTATITCSVKYSWYDSSASTGNHYKTGYTSKTYYISAKPTEVKLSKTSLELEIGDEVELSYTTNPSGLEPEVEWRTTDPIVAKIEGEYNQGYRETISNEKKITVWAVSVGTCVIKLGCNTGYSAPTCSITVKDERPHLTADVASGSVKKGTKVTLTCDITGADIRYTTDGSDPTKSSQKYTSPIILNESITLKAIAYANGTESKILKRDYQIVAHLSGEVFTYRTEEGVDMVLKAYMKSETDAYTYLQIGTGESGKTAINKNYSGKITVPAKVDGMVVQQIAEYAFDGCGLSSISLPADFAVMSFRFAPHSFRNCSNLREIRIPHCALVSTSAFENCNSLKKVIFSNIVIFNNSLSAAIQQNTASNVFSGCTGIKEIYANYDNPYPINDDVFPTNVYSDAILYVPNNATSKYKSTNGWKKFNNIVAIGSEPNKKLVLTASPSGGEVSKGTVIHLTATSDGSTVSGCDIYYTLNGTAPTKNSTPYTSSGITINSDCTLKAIAYKSGYEDSEVLTETYTIKETPKLKLVLSATPSGGQVSSGTKVTLTAKADGSIVYGCDIYYTLNGSTPTKSSTPYTSSGITITNDCTLKAIAYKDGYEASEVLTTTYTIKPTPQPKLTLTASPSGGQVSAGTKVTLTAKADGSTVSGCDIYYTLNGNTPTKNSTPYTSSGITINSDCTLKAIAYKSGYENSDEEEWNFTIKNNKIDPTNISIPSSCTIKVGEYVRIEAKLTPSNATTTLTWYLDDSNIAKYDWGYSSAIVFGLKVGSTKIHVRTSNGLTSSCNITVTEANMITNVKNVIGVEAGNGHSLILTDEGRLFACGDNSSGQLGNGNTTSTLYPIVIMDDVASMAAGCWHTFILKEDGTLWACGGNSGGRLGDGTTTNRLSPVRIMDEVASVAGGQWHSLIIKKDRSLWACGDGFRGALGLGFGHSGDQPIPQKVMDGVASVSAGGWSTMIVKEDGTLWACGDNWCGNLGDGTTENCRFKPVKIMDNVTSVATSGNHSLIIKKDKTVWACGQNKNGRLGDGTLQDRSTPVKVMDDVISVAAGSYGSFFLKTDGSLWGCGGVYINSGSDSKVPVKLMENVSSIKTAQGNHFFFIIKKDGTLWACGDNSYGQLGDGTTIDRKALVYIMGEYPFNVVTSSSGYASFYNSNVSFCLPNGLSAQVVTGAADGKLTYESIADGLSNGVVPKGVPVMIVSNTKLTDTFTLMATVSDATYTGTNLLRGSDEATTTTGDGYHYKLSYGPTGTKWDDVFGWYWGAQSGAPFQIEGHKAWLVVPKSGTRAAGFTIDGESVDIETVEQAPTTTDYYYDLQGRRITDMQNVRPSKKGVYIRNGQKVIVR